MSLPADETIVQEREPVTPEDLAGLGIDLQRDFPRHSIADLQRYPVLGEGGWFMVIKNRRTLETISRTKWRRLGPISLVSDGLDLD